MSGIEVRAPAKVNLLLRVLARESSGYHQIETLFCGIELSDRVRVAARDGSDVSLRVHSPWDLGPDPDNLARRAGAAFLRRLGDEAGGLHVDLEKAIPPGSGLGGGSSDAAAVLRAANGLLGEPLPSRALLALGGGLGSDVSFFLGPSPLALAWGRGERLLALPPLPSRPVLVAIPPFRISTADAYGALDRGREEGGSGPGPGIVDPGELSTWEGVRSAAENAFERVVFRRHGELERARDRLSERGAAPTLLSGSGSSLFGVFPDRDHLEEARRDLASHHPEWTFRATRTLERWDETTS